MSDKTDIEWTDATWNPVTGCDEVSPGCTNCYAKTLAERFRGTPGHYFENGFDVQLRPERLDQPIRWTKPRKIFVNSMSDLFHKDIPTEYIDRVFDVMEQTPRHTYQLLTKRHGRMRSYVRARMESRWAYADKFEDCPTPEMQTSPAAASARLRAGQPPANIWLGVSVEDQHQADIRIPSLLDTPAARRFLSCEPLLGPVDLWRSVCPHALEWRSRTLTPPQHRECCPAAVGRLDWVIVGGESGHGARPMHPAWARSLRDECTAAGVPFHFKQWGEWAHGADGNLDYRRHIGLMTDGQQFADPFTDIPHGILHDPVRFEQLTIMRRVGKKAAGRELDGRTWDEYPAVAAC